MSGIDSLTNQESAVLALVTAGKRNAEIAGELFVSINTVESHLYRIFQKLDVSSRTQAAVYAIQNGLLSTPKFTETTDDSENERH